MSKTLTSLEIACVTNSSATCIFIDELELKKTGPQDNPWSIIVSFSVIYNVICAHYIFFSNVYRARLVLFVVVSQSEQYMRLFDKCSTCIYE